MCVCVWWCVCVSVSEQNSSRTEAPIWTRFLLNGCLLHWLGPYWNWWHWVKSQGQSDTISIFFFTILFLLIYIYILLWISAILCWIKMKLGMSLGYAQGIKLVPYCNFYFLCVCVSRTSIVYSCKFLLCRNVA